MPSRNSWTDDTTVDEVNPVPLGQFVAVSLSVLWALAPGFGLIDLETAIPPANPEFRDDWFLEEAGPPATVLIVAPVLVAAVRPAAATDVAKQQTVLVGCFVLAAILCMTGTFLILPIGLGLSTLAWWWPLHPMDAPTRQPNRIAIWWPYFLIGGGFVALPLLLLGPGAFTAKTIMMLAALAALVASLAHATPERATRPEHVPQQGAGQVSGQVSGQMPGRVLWPLLVTTAVTAGPWLGYAWAVAADSRGGFEYISSGIDRVVAQSALGLIMVALPAAAAVRWLPVRLAVGRRSLSAQGSGCSRSATPTCPEAPGQRGVPPPWSGRCSCSWSLSWHSGSSPTAPSPGRSAAAAQRWAGDARPAPTLGWW